MKSDGVARWIKRSVVPYENGAKEVTIKLAFLLLLVTVLYVIRMFLFYNDNPSGGFFVNVVDNLVAGIITAASAVVIVFVLASKASVREDLEILDSWNIGPVLSEPLASTRSYYFRGRSGRWIRSDVLPALAKAAREDGSLRSLSLILPDPCNDGLLSEYATYRNSLNFEKGVVWTLRRVRVEILATILESAKISYNNAFFQVEIALQGEFSLLRSDLTDERLVLTREDPKLPGWAASKDSQFYRSYLEDLRMSKRRSKSVAVGNYPFPPTFCASDVAVALKKMGIVVNLEDGEEEDVILAMDRKENPYA